MKLTVFQSDKGDCLLLSSSDGKHVLADGGMASSFSEHVAPTLGEMRQQGEQLDLVYVSHIDQDHISGVLRMMDDHVAWRVHEFQVANDNPDHPEPTVVRPPEVSRMWHNAFHEQVGENAGPIADMLAANASLLSVLNYDWARQLAEHCANLAASKAEAVKLSRRVGSRQLNIPLNPEYEGHLMYVTDPPESISVGQMSIAVIGPFVEDLDALRREWNAWLRSQKGREQIRAIRRQAREDEENLGASEIDLLIQPFLTQAQELGDREEVTVPNLASLMLLVEEDGKSVLMTGDGHWEDILAGLDACGRLDAAGNIHVNVLKVQHHGSEHNVSPEFCRRVTADDYVFCGNGAHENPDLRVVEAFVRSRTGSPELLSPNAQVGDPFKMWFNSGSMVTRPQYRDHMEELEREVAHAVSSSNGQMSSFFLDNSSFVLEL